MNKNKEASHTLKLSTSGAKEDRLGIRHEHRRLYKFLDWREAEPVLRRFLKSKVLEFSDSFNKPSDFSIQMDSVNPMRKSMFGPFYLEVKGKVLTPDGEIELGTLEEFLKDKSNVPIPGGYDTHDVEESTKRADIEAKFGRDQFNKEVSIRQQAVTNFLSTVGGTYSLDISNEESVNLFINSIMNLTGWEDGKDNRIHTRIKRLPPWVIVPE